MRTYFWACIALLVACNQTPTVEGIDTLNITVRSTQSSTIDIGNAPTQTWTLRNVPSSLTVTPSSGTGAVRFTVQRKVGQCLLATDAMKLEVTTSKGLKTINMPLIYQSTLATPRNLSGNEVLVQYKNPQSLARMLYTRDLGSAVGEVVLATPESGRVIYRNANIQQLSQDPRVAYIAPIGTVKAQNIPSKATDEYFGQQWFYKTRNSKNELQDYSAIWGALPAMNTPVTVAVIDSGVRFQHPDLANRLVKAGALDFQAEDTDPTDPDRDICRGDGPNSSHGTAVAGLIVANSGSFAAAPCTGCSTSGVVGVAYGAPVKVLPLRVLNAHDVGDYARVTTAIRYALGEKVILGGQSYQYADAAQVKVINLSVGSEGDASSSEVQDLCAAVKAATDKGVLVVAAAGNDRKKTNSFYPAACDGALGVAALSPWNDKLQMYQASYSNSGAVVKIAAAGGSNSTTYNATMLNGQKFTDSIFSTDWNFDASEPNYSGQTGTSFAAPQISAIAALLYARGWSRAQVWSKLIQSTDDLGNSGLDDIYGYGAINPVQALDNNLPR